MHSEPQNVAVDVASATPPTGLRALFGEVSDLTGTHLVGATVTATLTDGSMEARTTDSAGAFTLDALRAPILRVRFSAPGYADASVESADSGSRVNSSLRLPALAEAYWSQQLKPSFSEGTGRIEGVVVDRRGTPITSFRLLAYSKSKGKERTPAADIADLEDANGAFAREATGSLSLLVIAAGFRPSERLEVAVEPGHVERVRIVLERSNALSGRVSDAQTDAPIAGALVSLDRVGGVEAALTDAEGRYRIASLPRVKVSVRVSADGYRDLAIGGVGGGRSRDEVLDVTLTPHPVVDGGAGAQGTARGTATTEVVGIGVSVFGNPAGVLVREVFANGPAYGVLARGDVILEVDGVSMAGKPLGEGMAAIRGESGTTVRMLVTKKGGSPRSVTMERTRVAVPAG